MTGGIAGVLLAGGLGRRMGGVDKALVTLAGRPLIAQAAARLQPQVGRLIVNANGDASRFAALGLPVVADESGDLAGPLAGVLASLRWLVRETPGARGLVSLPADTPFVPGDLVRRLAEALASHGEAGVAVALSRGRRHHVIGLWRPETAGDIAAALARGERKAETMVDRLGAIAVPFEDSFIGGQAVDPFFNVNTPDDLAFAERVVAGTAAPFVVGVAGWKNSGKTTLVVRLVRELIARGYRVSTVKHTHHDVGAEADGTDSARHREAGAHEVVIITPQRWGVITGGVEIAWRAEHEVPLAAIVAQLAPVDIVIVEGLKRAPIPKIEVRRMAQGHGPPLADNDPAVFAIAADHGIAGAQVPVLALDDVAGLADALLAAGGLALARERA